MDWGWNPLQYSDMLAAMPLDWSQVRVHAASPAMGRVRCEPGWRLHPGWSQRLRDFDFWFVWAGRGHMQTHQGRIDLRPGIGLWMRPGGRYEAEQDLKHRLGVSFVHFDVVDKVGRSLVGREDWAPPEVHDVPDVQYVDSVMRRVVELAGPAAARTAASHGGDLATADALLTGLLMDLAARAEQAAPAIPGGTYRHHYQIIMQAVSRITESIHDVPPLAELARQAGYTPDHFARIFRTVLGQSPQNFILQARIDRARQLLTESDLSISQIADVLGYRDVYFFSRQFRQKTGHAPSDYRRRP